jgi:hypothetical protein
VASRPYIDIPFGPYLPDLGGIPNPEMPGYLVDAAGVRSTPNGYRSQPTFSDVGVAVGSGVAGTAIVLALNTDNRIFAITNTAITDPNGKVWCSSDSGATWSETTPAADNVYTYSDFVVFGDEIYMSTTISGTAGFTLYSRAISDPVGTDFASVTGAPRSIYIARVRDHIVASELIYDIRWCAIGDPTDWPTPGTQDARSKQAGSQSLQSEYGYVQRIVGGEKFGLIFQRNAITRMTYVGGAAVYEFDTFTKRHGGSTGGWGVSVAAPLAVATDGTLWYWMNEQGVFATDGYSVRRLSNAKVEEALFLDSLAHDDAPLNQPYGAAYDERRNQIIFSTLSGTSSNRNLAYNIATGEFTFFTSTVARFVFDSIASATDAKRTFYNFNSSRVLQKLTGTANGSIALQTGYIEIDPGYRVQLQGAHLLGTGTGSLTLAYKTAATSADCDLSQSGFTSLTAAGLGQKKTGRASSQYFAFRVTGTGADAQLIKGIRVYVERAEPAP